MNFLQKIAGTLFPPYKFNVLRKEAERLFYAIIESLPEEYASIKEQTRLGNFHGFKPWKVPSRVSIRYIHLPSENLNKFGRLFAVITNSHIVLAPANPIT